MSTEREARPVKMDSKGMRTLRAHARVADIECEGMDEGRFFVHLREEWRFTFDGSNAAPIRSRSISRVRDSAPEVRTAVRVTWHHKRERMK